ncbi:glycosyltransferase family 2 protein [Humisphaera borealis]|uniref:Glycosyltransferase family 2 protein n=1 Tax=Humisphaera borealis TaxID=2807512 RepID=A0A7M2WYY5_9BACT|nr:glycosyltransferase family 2 protein [Humisphaera borealis]QOV90737.1 glycosyltransferase family 2 protein [Humisphaera borealis]
MKLLIAIPVHNERKYVEKVLRKVRSFHDDILVVDDGSTDGTSQVLGTIAQAGEIHLIRHRTNQGYGQSLIDAFAFADHQGYDWVITMDCDEQHEPRMIPAFKTLIESDRYDLISGSRYLRPLSTDDLPPPDRQSINAKITALLNRLFNWRITDAFCGFKAHRVSAMNKLSLTETGYAFPLQLWPQVCAAGLRLTELPVRLIYNDATRTFGGNLDDAGRRLRHYLGVLSAELTAQGAFAEAAAVETDGVDARVVRTDAAKVPAACGCIA